MSGNFDFPPASDANSAIGSTQARFDDLSRNLQRDREEFNAQREAAAAERQSTRHTLTPHTARRRRIASSRGPPRPPVTDSRPLSFSARPPDPPRLRRQESRENLRRQLDDLDIMSQELRDVARRRLDSASNDLNATHRSVAVDHVFLRQRKRRKLDHDGSKTTGCHTKPYGYYGQVEPGLLRMEIVSCDGGDYPRDPMALYRAENILRNDRSVYCTRSSQCNLLLRHQDEVVFTVNKITIKAPENGFTAPLQQGLIFIGYDSDELVKGAKPYRIQYKDVPPPLPQLPSRPTSPSSSRDRDRLTLFESLHDDHISRRLSRAWDSYDRRRSADDYPSVREVMEYMDLNMTPDREDDRDDPTNDEACDFEDPTSDNGITRAPTPPPFTVTAVDTDDESDSEIAGSDDIHDNLPPPPTLPWEARPSPRAARRDDSRARRPLLTDYMDASSDDETRWASAILDEPPPPLRPPSAFRALPRETRVRPNRRSSPGRIAPPPPPPLRGSVVGEPKEGETMLTPNAKFFISRHQSRIHVKFDPPVSGRFLLLKFFSPQLKDRDSEDNIDVQYVAAHGFAGPRYFPAVQMQGS